MTTKRKVARILDRALSFFRDKKNKKLVTFLEISLLVAVLVIFTIPFRESRFTFDWDQANDYQAVASIAAGKMTLIGPRVTSDTGFFLGPWHYYFLLPFYFLFQGSLYTGFWAALFVQLIFVIASYLLGKKWFGDIAGVAAGLFAASPVNLSVWGFMYVPLLSLLFFYLCLKTLDKPKNLPYLYLFFGFGCTTYAVFYALGIPLMYITAILFLKKKISLKTIFFGVVLAALPYLPLAIFDLRHDFLNLKNILGFAGSQHNQGEQFGYFLKVFFRAVEFYWLNREFTYYAIPVVSLTLLFLIIGASRLFKRKTFVLLWCFSSLIPLAFFKGNISEYYYTPVTLLIPFVIAGLLSRHGNIGKIILVVFCFLLIRQRLIDVSSIPVWMSMSDKIEVVNKMENMGEKYSVSYEFNPGEDNGYNLLFEKIGKNYVKDGSSQLYTITYRDRIPTNASLEFYTNKLAVYKR